MPNDITSRTRSSAEETEDFRARAAQRMRRSRQRRREGLRCYTLLIRDEEIKTLIRRGFLAPDQQTNRLAVVKALHAFLDHAFQW